MPSSVDVLLFEDRADQVTQIVNWLGLTPSQYAFCPKFTQVTPTGRHPNDEADQGWRWIESEIRRVDPKVVVLDYLLAKQLGNLSYDGLHSQLSGYKSNRARWLGLGVLKSGAFLAVKASNRGTFSNNERLRICKISDSGRSIRNSCFTIATST